MDATAAVLSNLADYGVAWVVVAGIKARRPGVPRRRAVAALATAGVSSYILNKSIKVVVARERPEPADPGANPMRRPPVRAPSSSSFPSGHTLAATCTALVLSEGPAETAALLTLATGVAISRVHLRDHHASDVVGGLAIGAALGVAGRRLVRRLFADPATGAGMAPPT